MPRHLLRPITAALGLASVLGALGFAAAVGPAALADSGSAAASATVSGPSTQAAPRPPADESRYVAAVISERAVLIRQHRASRAHRRTPLSALPPRTIGRRLASRRGWDGSQWTCLDELWVRESGWQVHDTNGGSGAYGIPQALPASKMAWAGADWRENPVTQIRWGLHYIAARYGDPCEAWSHSQSYDYY